MTDYKKKILEVLDFAGGFTTGTIARKISPMFGHNMRCHSMSIRSWLVDLERQGLVRKLDDQKPVCWCLVRK